MKNVETNTHTHTCVCHVGGKMKSQKRSRKKNWLNQHQKKQFFVPWSRKSLLSSFPPDNRRVTLSLAPRQPAKTAEREENTENCLRIFQDIISRAPTIVCAAPRILSNFNKSLTSPFSESCDVCDCECVVIKLKSFFFPKKNYIIIYQGERVRVWPGGGAPKAVWSVVISIKR